MVKFNRKIIIIIGVVLVLVGIIASQTFLKNGKQNFSVEEVKKGNLVQEVSETGTVELGQTLNLSFKTAGRIESVYVKVGDKVLSGQSLAKLDANQLQIQYEEAKANVAAAQAKLDKLIAGASAEEIQVVQTGVNNAQIALDQAEQNLEDAYQDAINTLDDAYLKLYNTTEVVKTIQRTYFYLYDQEGVKVGENKKSIESNLAKAKFYLDIAKNNSSEGNISSANSEMRDALNSTSLALSSIRQSCEEPLYRSSVSSTDKTSLDTQRTNINTALTNITSSQQTISSMKLTFDSAQGDLQAAEDQLALKTAKPRQEDINLYQAQVNQTQAQADLLGNQIWDATLKSPTAGQITSIDKKAGETVQAAVSVIGFLAENPFEIKVDIYEEDVVKVKIGDPVEISLVAFPDQTFSGKVISINPAEKLVNEVVYYEVTIDFNNIPEGLKSGMTADLVIKTATRDNVLIISKDAIFEKDGKSFVKVLKNGKGNKKDFEEREIKTGLEGSDGNIEIISGLSEGEKVIIE